MVTSKEAIREIQKNTCKRTFFLLPTLDRYVLREFMIPFSILLFAFTFLFLIGDIFNDLSDFLEYHARFRPTFSTPTKRGLRPPTKRQRSGVKWACLPWRWKRRRST